MKQCRNIINTFNDEKYKSKCTTFFSEIYAYNIWNNKYI